MKALAFVLLALAACGSQTIDLTREPAPGAEGGPPMPCALTSDCHDGSYCAKSACADAKGTCAPFPASCPSRSELVCGCDGITYSNDCMRTAAGVSASNKGPCTIEGW